MTFKTIEKARFAASKRQAQETNTAGWWKIKTVLNGYEIYYDSAKTRDGVAEDENANTDIFYDEMERRREVRTARRQL